MMTGSQAVCLTIQAIPTALMQWTSYNSSHTVKFKVVFQLFLFLNSFIKLLFIFFLMVFVCGM